MNVREVLIIVILVTFVSAMAMADGAQQRERTRANWQVRTCVEGDTDSDARVELKLRNHHKKGAKLRVKAKGLEEDAECEFRVLDAETGEVLATKECRTNKRGRLRIKARSREGDPLFCGEENGEGLAGARFEICYRNGDAAAEGEIPAP
jgi:hypothetical protein